MTHIEMLQNPEFKRSLENKIVAHINTEYKKRGLIAPFHCISFPAHTSLKQSPELKSILEYPSRMQILGTSSAENTKQKTV